MSSPPIPAESPQHEQTNESDVVCGGTDSLNQNQTKPDSEAISHQQPISDPEEISREEEEAEEEDDDEEATEHETLSISPDMSLHVDPTIVSVSDVSLPSPTGDPETRRSGVNRAKHGKGKGFKGKSKFSFKKLQAIQEKAQTLMKNMKPISFIAHKILYFVEHEKLLKKLGLWDFIHLDFDREVRVDLVAQLIASYNAKSRCSYVNGIRIRVSRADLARAFKLPSKKEKGNVGGGEVDSDCEALNDESISLIVDFVSDWVLLHEDTWMTPKEVMECFKLIKDGHPEKVDWAGLLWFMVEKELKQGVQLTDCYYASHLQHLMKYQREDLFEEEEENEANSGEGLDEEATEQERDNEQVNEGENVGVGGEMECPVEEVCEMGGPSTDLTLGQDGEKEEGKKDVEMMDIVEKGKEVDEEREEEVEEEDQQREWLLPGKNEMEEHFMQRCENAGELVSTFEDKNAGEEAAATEAEEDMDGDEEDEDKFHVFPNDDSLEGDGFTGNLLQAMETNQLTFPSQQMDSGPSFFNNEGKRVIDHDNHISHHGVNESSKRLRMNDSWEHKPMDVGTYLENIEQMAGRARLLLEEKEQAFEQSNMNQQILLNELQKRDAVIEHLHKTRLEEMQKKDGEIYRLERELYLMGSVLDGYRKALKETQKVFAEYREKAQLFEEPTYKDAGQGGLMLTAAEIRRLEKKREDEYKMNCLILEQKMKEAEEDYAAQFDMYVEKVNFLDKRLMGIEADAKEVIKLFGQRKIVQTDEENMPDAEVATESAPILENDEEKLPDAEVATESAPILEDNEEKLPDAEVATESAPILENDEEKLPDAEVATESPPVLGNDEEKVPEVATESAPVQENNEKACQDEDEVKESAVIPEDEEKVPESC